MPLGHSSYHSFQLQFNKRFGSFSARRGVYDEQGDRQYREPERLAGRRRSGHQHGLYGTTTIAGWIVPLRRRQPQRLVVSYSIELPFGKGRHL